MVVAAYNCGEHYLDFAMERAGGSNDFWEVYKFLPRETRKYVPHFLGIVDAMNSFTAQAELASYLKNNGVVASDKTDNKFIASTSNEVALAEVKANNSTFKNYAEKSTKSESVYMKEYFVYIIKQGDSMESISKLFPKNTTAMIKDNNNVSSNAELNIGSTLLLEK